MNQNKTTKYFKYAIGEIILVMVGILLALQVNNWNENRKISIYEKELLTYALENLKTDSIIAVKKEGLYVHDLKSVNKSWQAFYFKKPLHSFKSTFSDSNILTIASLNKHNLQKQTPFVTQLKATDFDGIKRDWVITKVHRTMILNPDGTIKNAFVNLFDINFKNHFGKKIE